SDVNVVAIQHALQQTGLKAQPVDVIVTLPISEYLDANNQKNKQNIERKKKNVMREVRVQGSDAFVIRSVSVLPESIPAGFSVLAGLEDDESLLIVDLGGTTLDVSHVRSKMTGITKTWCDPNIGVSLITSGVKEQMAVHANTRVSSFQADNIIVHRNEPDYLSRRIYNAEQRESIINVINERQKLLIKRVNDVISRFTDYTHVMCVGGGAEIVAEAVKNLTKVPDERFYLSSSPQFDLVMGMIKMKGGVTNE
ncbi:TPA: recombinase, partial [Escherichia coli]|nr:recombinase [Escherichia coli]